jgi:hypothetical protein
MKVKTKILENIEALDTRDLLQVYNLILDLQERPPQIPQQKLGHSACLLVREALKGCKGSLSNDIRLLREERI